MQQFILEKKLEGICDKDGRDHEEVEELEKDKFIQVMLEIHQANSMAKYGENHKNGEIGPIPQNLRPICGGLKVLGDGC